MGVAERYKNSQTSKEEKKVYNGVAYRHAVNSDIFKQIENRVNTWLKNNNTFIENYNYKVGKQDSYMSDSSDWLSTITTQKSNFDREAESILNVLNEYKGILSDEYIEQINNVLSGAGKVQTDILNNSTKWNEHWSQWENEGAYNDWVAYTKEQERLFNLDVDATTKQADTYKAAAREVEEIEERSSRLAAEIEKRKQALSKQENARDRAALKHMEAAWEEYELQKKAVAEKYGIVGDYSLQSLKEQEAKFRQDATYAEYKQIGKTLKDEALKASDFETDNKYGAEVGGIVFGEKDYIKNWLNDVVGKSIDFYDAMTEEEKKILGYYLAHNTEHSTKLKPDEEVYLYSIEEEVNGRLKYGIVEEKDTAFEKILFSFEAGLDQFASGMGGVVDAVLGEDGYKPSSATQMASGEIRQEIAEGGGFWNGALGVAYDLGTTTANMLPSILIGIANPVVGTTFMGASAGGNAYTEMINLGYSKGQAIGYGTLVGASEALLERFLGGMSALGGKGGAALTSKLLSKVDNAFARVAIQTGGSMISEFTEESLQTILEPWFKSLTTGVDYDAPNIDEVLYSGLLGALSAGILEGGGNVISAGKTTYQGHKLKKNGDVDALTSYAETLPDGTDAKELASKVKTKDTAYTVGRLFNSLGEGLTSQNHQAIHDYLTSKGVQYEHASMIGDVIAKSINGEALSARESMVLRFNPLVKEALNTVKQDGNYSVDIDPETGEYIIKPSKLRQTLNANNEAYDDVHASLKALAKKTAGVAEDTESAQDGAGEAKAINEEQTVAESENAAESVVEADAEASESVAEIKNIASIENGKVTYNLEDGTTSSKATTSNKIEGLVYESVTEMDATVDTANSILDKVRTDAATMSEQDLRARFFGIKEVYWYGRHGISADEISRHGFTDTLTEAEREWAYDLGKKDRAEQTAKKEAAAKSKRKPTARQGENEVLNKDGLYYDKRIKKSSLNAMQRASVDVAKQIHKILGVDVHLFASYVKNGNRYFRDANGVERKAPNGMYINGNIYIDINAGNKGEGIMLNTLAHELTHHIEEWSPEKYKKLCDFLMEQYAEKGISVSDLVYREIAKAKKNGRDVSFDEAYSDVIANSMEKMLHDGTVLNKLAQTDIELFNKVKAFVDKIVARIKEIYANVDAESLAGKYVARMNDSFTEIQNLFADALIDAGENYKAATIINDAISNIEADVDITDENVAVQMATDVVNATQYSERDTTDEESYSKIGKEMMFYAEGDRKPDLTLVEVYNERTGKTETTVKFVGDKPKGYVPKKIAYCYKLFEQHPDGTLHALFAGASNATPVDEWVYSKGFPYTDSGVKGMNLRERYGWHLSAGLPSAPHLMSSKAFERGYPSKNAYGHPKGSKRVWVRMAYDASMDFNSIADSTKAGDIFGLIPFGGFYAFKENNQSEWVISSGVKIDKILKEEERQQILKEAGYDEYEAWRKKHRATEAEKAESKRKSAENKKAKDEAKKKGLNYLSENSKAMREAINKRIIDNPELDKAQFSERESEDELLQLREEYSETRKFERDAKKKLDSFGEYSQYDELTSAVADKNTPKEKVNELLADYKKWQDESGYTKAYEEHKALQEKARKQQNEIQRMEERLSKELREKKYSDEEIAKFVQKAVRKFHTTQRLDKAAYLLTTGSMLDFSDGQGYRVKDHREISEILDLPDYAQYADGMITFMNMGNIRLQTYGIDISAMPNSKQIASLRGIIPSVMREYDEFTVDFSKSNGNTDGSVTYPKGVSSARIISDIKGYFETGVVPEYNDSLSQFRYSEREDVDKYTEKEYNNFGWARANEVLSARENADLRSKFAAAVSKQTKPPKTKVGEYMISIGDVAENKVAYMKGTIDDPIITRIVEIDEYDETELAQIRSDIYALEGQGIRRTTEGIFTQYSSSDFGVYETYKRSVSAMPLDNKRLGTKRGRSSKKAKEPTGIRPIDNRTYAIVYSDGTEKVTRAKFSERDQETEQKVIKRLKTRAMSSKYVDNYATYTAERMDREIREASSNTVLDYAKSYITWVSPIDFIYATTYSEQGRKQLEKEAGTLDIERLKRETQPIHLTVNFETGEITGHEGRHRMLALQAAGIDNVAVIIDALNDDRQNTKPIEFMRLKGQYFGEYRSGTDMYLHDMLPLSKRYADTARELFTNKPKSEIQFSERDPDYAEELEKLNKTLEKENAKLKEDKQNLKELLALQKKVTNGKMFTQTSVIAAAKKLMKYANAKGEAVELARLLNTYYEGIARSENLDWDDLTEAAAPAAKWLKDHTVVKYEVDETAMEVRRYLKSQRVNLTEEQKAEAEYAFNGYNNFRKKAMGYVTISEDAVQSLEKLWLDLSENYPYYFDSNVKPADMPNKLIEVMSSISDEAFAREAEYEYEASEAMIMQDLVREVYNGYWDVSTLHTVADKAQKEIMLLKAKHNRQMGEAKEHLNETIAKLKQDKKEQVAKVRKQYQDIVKSHEDKLIAKHQEQRERAKESRTKTEMRHKIKKVVNDLNRLLLTGNKESHVKLGLQPAVAAALEAINFDTVAAEQRLNGYTDEDGKYHKGILQKIAETTDEDVKAALEKTRDLIQTQGDAMNERLDALRKAYSNIQSQKGDFPDYYRAEAKMIEDRINVVIEQVGKTPLRFMTFDQLAAVHDLYTMVLTTVRNSNNVFKQGKTESLQANAASVMTEIQNVKKLKEERSALGEKMRSFLWNEFTPFYAFSRIGSKTLSSFFWELTRGQNVYAQDIAEAKAFASTTREKYGYKNWDTRKVHEFKLEDGRTFRVSLAQMLSIYAYSKRKQALEHMSIGGFFFNDKFTYRRKGKLLEQIKSNEEGYCVNEAVLNSIKSELTEEQVKYVDEMQAYLTDMGKKGNEVTRIMWGIDIFKEAVYFPLRSVKDFIYQANQPAQESSLKNDGMTKETKPHASNPIVLENFDDVWSSHVERMSQYHGFVIPIDNLNKVLNYGTWANTASVSISTMLSSRYGSAVNEYLTQFIKDLNGSVSSQGASNPIIGMVGKFKKTAVAASASVVIQQPTAVIRALSEIDAKYFVGKPHMSKETYEQLKKYAPIAIVKEIGGFDAGSGRQAKDWLNADTYKGVDKVMHTIDDVSMWAAGKADVIGWLTIWDAVKRECVTKYTNLAPNSEEFLQKAGERFTEVIVKTQVYDSTLSRSGYMRSKSDTVKMATSFMGEPTLSINGMADAVIQLSRGTIPKGRAIRTIAATYASMIAASAAASLIYAMRDDDDDESFVEKYLEAFGDKLVSDINPLSMLPFVKDIMSIFEGWEVERTDMAIIQDIYNAWESLDSDTKSPYRKVEDFAGAIAAAFGVPVKNVMRTGREIYNFVEDIFDKNAGGDLWGAFAGGITGEDKKTPKTTTLYEAILSGDDEEIEKLKNGYKDEASYESAVKKALRENDERIKEAAEAYYSGDIRERDKIREEIAAEGFFEEELVAKAIDSEASYLENKFKAAAKAEAEGDAEEYEKILKTLVEEMHYDEAFVLEGIAKEAASLDDTEEEEEKLTSVYRADDINTALESGDKELALEIIDDLVKTKVANGKEEKEARSAVKSSVTSYWKPLYKAAYKNKDAEEMKRIRYILLDTGLYGRPSELLDTCRDWIKELAKEKNK